MLETIEDIKENFAFLDNWAERYQYIITLGSNLSPYPDDLRNEAHKVSGCFSQVWLHIMVGEGKDPILTLQADSDAYIVRGLIYLVIAYYSGKSASEILAHPIDTFLADLALDKNLSPQRSNGLHALINKIHNAATAAIQNIKSHSAIKS